MGIIGLTSLIEVNPHLLNDIELHDTNLVIDGNSFSHQLHTFSRVDSRFGGDYLKFEAIIDKFLHRCTSCSIRPIFVFDGLMDAERLKWKTALQRQRIRLRTAKCCVESNSYCNILPLLSKNTLMDILKRRGIEIYQCAGEADAIIAGLANDRQAPVLSQDSDFFIFDLKCGYIPFETLQFDEEYKTDCGSSFIRAKMYRLDNLLEHYPDVDRRLLPLFAFLCGNDFSSGHDMNKFFEHIYKPDVEIAGINGVVSSRKRRSNKGIRPARRHCNMLAVLEWLQGKTNDDKTMENALQWIQKDRRDTIKLAMTRSLNAYRRCELMIDGSGTCGSFDVVQFIENHISHLSLSKWMIDAYIKGELHAIIFQLLQDRRIFLSALIEDFSKPSIYDSSQCIRICIYRILLKHEPEENRFISEYSRKGTQLVKQMVQLYDDSEVVVPDLNHMDQLTALERQKYFLDSFNLTSNDLDIVKKFPERLVIFVCCLMFWFRSEDVQATRHQALALLCCCFWLCTCKVKIPVFATENEQMLDLESEYDYAPSLSKKKGNLLNLAAVHCFDQWQTCFQAASSLNDILLRPFGDTVPIQYLFHGRIIYNLTTYFKKSKSESAALEHLFKSSPRLAKVFRDLWTIIEGCLPNVDTSTESRKKQSKQRKPKPKADVIVLDVDESPANEPKDGESSQSSDELWGLENRFKSLVSLR